MASSEEKETGMLESHGIDSHQAKDERRGSTAGEKFRSSISVQHAPEDAVEGQIFSMNDVDPVLDMKMRLVNQVQSTASLTRDLYPDATADH